MCLSTEGLRTTDRGGRETGEAVSRVNGTRRTRRRFLEAVGVAGFLGLAGCSGDPDGGDDTPTPTSTPTGTPTPTPTPTPTQASEYTGTLGAEAMFDATPAHPGLDPTEYVWARHVNVGGVLSAVDDRTIAARLRGGWLGSGPPVYTDSDAFELVHVQSREVPAVTFGYGDFSPATVIEGLIDDDWRREGEQDGFDRLQKGGYTTAVGDAAWLVMRTAEGETDAMAGLIDAVGTDPLSGRLEDVDTEAVARAATEDGNYHVLERSVSAGYAAGIAVEYAPHRPPVGVMQHATDRASPVWERIETGFEERIVGEVRRSAFGEEFA